MCNQFSYQERIEKDEFFFLNEVHDINQAYLTLRYINSGRAIIALREALELLK